MERNLDRRVETLCPVLDRDIARFIRNTILEAYLLDTERASVLRADGSYEPATGWRRGGCPAAARIALVPVARNWPVSHESVAYGISFGLICHDRIERAQRILDVVVRRALVDVEFCGDLAIGST
jgi:hypothetical protein